MNITYTSILSMFCEYTFWFIHDYHIYKCFTILHKEFRLFNNISKIKIITEVNYISGQHIPLTCPPDESQCLPGCNEHVRPYKEEAEFWKKLHLDMGCPQDGLVAEYKRSSKAQFHYTVRSVKCRKKQLKKDKLMNAMLEGDRNIFDEMRKLKGTNKKRSKVVDGLTNDGDIVSLFKEQNQTLINSCNYNNDSFKNMMQSVQHQILCNESNWQHVNISPENVKKSIQYLKRDKADVVVDLVPVENQFHE